MKARPISGIDGRIQAGPLGECLILDEVPREILADQPGLQFIRRTRGKDRLYFLDNRGEQPIDGWLPLAVPAASVAFLDPMTGRIGMAASRKSPARNRILSSTPAGRLDHRGSLSGEACSAQLDLWPNTGSQLL